MEENKLRKNEDLIITAEDIYTILSNYKIGKKPLAKLLGWGETTIIRYIDGDIPTNEYSDKLWTILNNPICYLDILTKNKDKLTGVAFKKSQRAVLSQLMESKLNIVAQHIVNSTNGEICATSVQAMLYYSQGFSLALYGDELFEQEYMVSTGGMPFPKVYNEMKERGISILDIGDGLLTEREKGLLEGIINIFSWYGPKAVTTILAYEKIALKISRDSENNKIISKETLKAYFLDIIHQYNIKKIADINNYTDQRFLQIKALIG